MEELQARPYKLPKSLSARAQLVHFGKILFNLQFVALAVVLSGILSWIVTALYYLVLLMISMATVFLIYVLAPETMSLWAGGETLAMLSEELVKCIPYSAPITIALSLLSIVFLCFDFREKQIGRIIASVFVTIIAAVALGLYLSGGAA